MSTLRTAYSTIEEALEDIVAGKMVVVVDDEDRENEGDLVMAAQFITRTRSIPGKSRAWPAMGCR
jgi:3,4-dihydroxy 2-butanone 4-phosphate synthase / GTP cyclohydrolase II